MADQIASLGVPVPEKQLRDLARDPLRALHSEGDQQDTERNIKGLQNLLDIALQTAEAAELSLSHRAAAFNLLCAIIDRWQASCEGSLQEILLDDSIWLRAFDIYLQRSDTTKSKATRQVLLTLTGVLMKSQSPRSTELKSNATLVFVEIICQRRDRLQVKPALQGLAHFLQKDISSVDELMELYRAHVVGQSKKANNAQLLQEILRSFLSWIVHHDTALSAGHLIKNFLTCVRQVQGEGFGLHISPMWIEPVVETLASWQDRVQEFMTHVFPHCFLPDTSEYVRFLSYLHLGKHLASADGLPEQLRAYDAVENGLETSEEFTILLAALQSGKELGIIKDVERQNSTIEIKDGFLYMPVKTFSVWLSDPEAEVRLAGLFMSVYSTAVTRPISPGVFQLLKRNLVHLHTDTDANFRKELLNRVQRLLERLRGSTATIAKTESTHGNSTRSPIQFAKRCTRSGKYTLALPRTSAVAKPFQFMLWYTQFLEWELRPTSSYQRRITALKALTIVLKSGLDPNVPHEELSKSAQGQLRWAHIMHISNPRLMRLLLDLILDPFDDIRSAAASLLELCLDSSSAEWSTATLLKIPKFLQRAETMMLRTGRADQADAVARTYSLLFSRCSKGIPEALKSKSDGLWTKSAILRYLITQLERTVDVASQDLSGAVNGRPVHGIFAALGYLLDQDNFYPNFSTLSEDESHSLRDLHVRIISCFKRLWSCIQDVLCADAPEGHVPEDLEEEASLDTKEILSYSWRGLKEASILLRTVITKAPLGSDKGSILSAGDVEELGKLCFVQLVELRHRGAFSTVAQTFAAFCRRCMTAQDAQLRHLPEIWYQDAVACIQAKASAITRRSAGIPALISAILAAEQPLGGPLFIRAMKDLYAEASQEAISTNIEESRLPQVHALNCIKDTFTTSKLSAVSEAWIGEGLDLAARTINSNIWPIRNCGLMLFKALIERLLGSDEAQDWTEQAREKSSRFSYNKYPHLLDILSNLLDPKGRLQESMETVQGGSPMDLHGAEGVFPALQILRQAPPHDPHRHNILQSVIHLLKSPHWHLRDMAARTIVSLHLPSELPGGIKMLAGLLGSQSNSQHGLLLSLKYMLRQYLRTRERVVAEELNDTLAEIQIQSAVIGEKSCPFTQAAFIDLFNLCDMELFQRSEVEQTGYIWSRLSSSLLLDFDDIATGDPSHSLLKRSLLTAALVHGLAPGREARITLPGKKTGSGNLFYAGLEDPDACCDLLDAYEVILRYRSSGSTVNKSDLLLPIFRLVLSKARSDDMIGKTQAILAEGFSIETTRDKVFDSLLYFDDPDWPGSGYLMDSELGASIVLFEKRCLEGSPAIMQSALYLLAYFLDFAVRRSSVERDEVHYFLVRYTRILRMAIIDTNPFDTRIAAVRSLSALDTVWIPYRYNNSKVAATIVGLSVILYDLLNDDDDEIREEAAIVTSKLMRAQGFQSSQKEAVPLITVQRLGKFFSTNFSDFKPLCKEALRRLTATRTGEKLLTRPFADILAEERKEDDALFAQEKQNLYKDDTEDLTFWADVLRRMSPAAVSRTYVSRLRRWVLEGLDTLTQTARNEVDGPLGWTTKAEVFTLGMRVICAADLVLRWEVDRASEVLLALRKFADIGAESDLNGLWLESVEHMLEESVTWCVRRARRDLRRIQIELIPHRL
ncbi:HEAT repeat protein-like protein [Sporormia fimetaria CBS 119925]|uniref:HEAT repeat protein-like protein n=1 Tax=Sporormia fimetaria CBS 119925 TaxID=1340428 RepID=A0A6A6UYQ2_9PLEO|nr:HEAT repeat protein-like protein [Sporormia fimetaria CBS 119925]